MPGVTISRKELRRDILRELGDLMILKATANGSDVTFIDQHNLIGEPGAYRGREAYVSGGTPANVGQLRNVTGSSQEARSITFGRPLPEPTAVGDEVELVNTRGTGWRIAEVHDAINRAIMEIGEQAAAAIASSEQVFTVGQGIPVPASFLSVERVAMMDPRDSRVWHDLPRSPRPGGHGWWYDPTTQEVRIGGNPAQTAHEREVVIWGAVAPLPLQSDSDTTWVNGSWLRAQAIANLLYGRFLRMPQPELERSMAYALQRADRLRGRAVTRRGPLAVRVRPAAP